MTIAPEQVEPSRSIGSPMLSEVRPPIVWLLGKVQSGKSSIVRTLTGCSDVEIGMGYKATTKTARIIDFPDRDPLIRFLDTRGLGEVFYDPACDIAACEQQAHLLLVVMKALDQQQTAVLDVVTTVRKRQADWPIVVAQTTLHQGYPPGAPHPAPYPFETIDAARLHSAGVSSDLIRGLALQRAQFENVPDYKSIVFVPVDFTISVDGYQPLDYGLPALIAALQTAAPAGIVASVRATLGVANAAIAARVHPQILSYAAAAAAADVVPFAGAIAVPGVQAKMLHGIAGTYGVPWDRRIFSQFAASLGTAAVIRLMSTFGIRELVKLIPVYGQTAGAAAAAAGSFATTFALGKAVTYFLGRRRLGEANPQGVQEAYAEALKQAFRLSRDHRSSDAPTDMAP